ncbi:MAG: hypothetical protein ACJATA_000373 [Sphingobacteriales bacterium]|jgi:hypothetical protein
MKKPSFLKQVIFCLITLLISSQVNAQWKQLEPPINEATSLGGFIDKSGDDIWFYANNVGPFRFDSSDSSWIPQEGFYDIAAENNLGRINDPENNIRVTPNGVIVALSNNDFLFHDGEEWSLANEGFPGVKFRTKIMFKFNSNHYVIIGDEVKSEIYKFNYQEKTWKLFQENNFPMPEEVKDNGLVVFEQNNVIYKTSDLENFEIIESFPGNGNSVEDFISNGKDLYQMMEFGLIPYLYTLKDGSVNWENFDPIPTNFYYSPTTVDSHLIIWRNPDKEPRKWNVSISTKGASIWDTIPKANILDFIISGGITFNDSTLMVVQTGIGPALFNTNAKEFKVVTKNIKHAYHEVLERDGEGNLYTFSFPSGWSTLRKGEDVWKSINFPKSHLIYFFPDYYATDSFIWIYNEYVPFLEIEAAQYISADFGQTWQEINPPDSIVTNLDYFIFAGNINDSLFFYESREKIVFLSTDNGQTFSIDSTFFPEKNPSGFKIIKAKGYYFYDGGGPEANYYRLVNGIWEPFDQGLTSGNRGFGLKKTSEFIFFIENDTLFRHYVTEGNWEAIPVDRDYNNVKGCGSLILGVTTFGDMGISANFRGKLHIKTTGIKKFTDALDYTCSDDGKIWLATNSDGLYYANIEEFTTSITTIQSNPNLILYPNPTNGLFSIQLSADNNKGVFKIYNLNGALVKSEEVAGETLIQLDINNHPKGIYFLTFSNEKGSVSAKIIKN